MKPRCRVGAAGLMAVMLLASCTGGDRAPAGSTSAPTPGVDSTQGPTETSIPETSESTISDRAPDADETTTTTVPTGATGVVIAREGVLGWWDGTTWVQAGASAPLVGSEQFQIFRLGDEPTTANATGLNAGCEFVEPAVGVDLTPDPWPPFDPFAPDAIGITAPWDATAHPIEELPVSDTYIGVAEALLEARGIDDPDPQFQQLVRTDIDGDGVDEVFGVIERRSDDSLIPAEPGDYSIAFARVVVDEEVQTAILGEWLVVEQEDETFIQDLIVYRIDALADADGDGVDEVAVRLTYYEGSGVTLWDWQGPDLGFVDVVSTGCGA